MKKLEHPGVIAALLALAVAVVLSGCWDAPFDHGDDRVAMLWANEHPATELVTTPFECFPVTLLSFKIDYALFGPPAPVTARAALDDPAHARLWSAGGRILNGIYALLAALVLWRFIRMITGQAFLASAVSVAWLVHPMSCESICWVVERKNVLAALFGFFALMFWMEEKLAFWRWPLVCLCYFLAVFSKASALGLLPVFAVLEIWQPQNPVLDLRRGKRWLDSLERLIVPTLISIGAVFFTARAFRFSELPPPGGSVFTALLTDVEIFGRYIRHILAPFELSFFYYVEPIVSLADSRLWIFAATSAAIVAVLIWLAGPQRRLAIFGILWFFVALSPNSNLRAGAFTMQDRFTFLAAPGLLLAVFAALMNQSQRWLKTPAPAAVYILLFAVLTAKLSSLYGDRSELAILAASRQPLSAFAQLSAANACVEKAQIEHAKKEPDARALKDDVDAALKHYDLAKDCPEFKYFDTTLVLQVNRAQLHMLMEDYAAVRETLNGWLPPAHLTMLPDNALWVRSDLHTGYSRPTLILAWTLACEAALQESNQSALSAERRIELCRYALHAAEESANLRADNNATLLKARVLLKLSLVETAIEVKRERYDAAVELLKGLNLRTNVARP